MFHKDSLVAVYGEQKRYWYENLCWGGGGNVDISAVDISNYFFYKPEIITTCVGDAV